MLNAEAVITALREADEYIKPIFLNGGCWRFYKFLKVMFPEAIPYKVAVYEANDFAHIVTKIGEQFFDITGEVHESDYRSCVPVTADDIARVEKWSFSGNNLLFKRCPQCGEEILFSTDGAIVRQF